MIGLNHPVVQRTRELWLSPKPTLEKPEPLWLPFPEHHVQPDQQEAET